MLLISKQQECHSIPLFHYVHVQCLWYPYHGTVYIELTNQKGDADVRCEDWIDCLIRLRSSVKVTDLGSGIDLDPSSPAIPADSRAPVDRIPDPGIDERYSEEL